MKCALCNNWLDRAVVVGEKARGGAACRRVVCDVCGLVQVSPRPSAEQIGEMHAAHDPSRETIRLRGRDIPPGTGEHSEALVEIEAERADLIAIAFGTDSFMRWDAAEHHDTVLAADILHRVEDPVAWLRNLVARTWCGRVLVEVPDVDAYTGDREGHHFRAAHLYDFSAATLVSTMLKAWLTDVHVVTRGDRLVAWGKTRGESILCDDAKARVAALTAAPIVEPVGIDTPKLDRWLGGESLADIGASEQDIRSELGVLQSTYGAMLDVWNDAMRTMSSLQDAWSRASRSQVEALVTDAWLSGAAFGRGVAYDQSAKAISHVLHRMGRMSGAYR